MPTVTIALNGRNYDVACDDGEQARVTELAGELRRGQLGAPGSDTLLALEKTATPPETPNEISLARKLVHFSDALAVATSTLRPHFLGLYLYELAGEFSAFYAAEKVIVDDPAIRARRILLCSRTLLILETGLHLLGLRTLQRM